MRPLTGEELNMQMDGLIRYINRLRGIATQLLVGLGINWGVTNSDYWIAVKLYHGLPLLFKKGFTEGTAKLGRPPVSWRELRSVIVTHLNKPNWIKGSRGYYAPSRIIEVLNNAERAGSVLKEVG